MSLHLLIVTCVAASGLTDKFKKKRMRKLKESSDGTNPNLEMVLLSNSVVR